MKTSNGRHRSLLLAVNILAGAALLLGILSQPCAADPILKKFPPGFTTDFRLGACTFSNVGSNEYFILVPGHQLNLAGEEDGALIEISITVLEDTQLIGPVLTRVVEERESEDGELIEVSRNFFAICTETNSVFYFGEEVDIYENGVIVSHDGSWRAFENGNQPGLIMPGIILLGASYFQEIAPGVALDRAIIIRNDAQLQTPAGLFENCLITFETTPLQPSAKDWKFYAPGIGLIKDGPVELVSVVTP